MVWGGNVKLSMTVTNSSASTSDNVWLVVESTGMTATPAVIAKDTGLQYNYKIGSSLVLKGPTIAAGKTTPLTATVFFEEPARIDYRVHAIVGTESAMVDALAAKDWTEDWGDVWTSVSLCY